MSFIEPFSKLSKNDAPIAGGKGASLGEMTRAGIPVPPGFVILAGAFEHFLEKTALNVEIDSILHTVDQKEMHTVESASEKIQALILNAKMPEDIVTKVKEFYTELDAQYVAVRSSATAEDGQDHAWAGQLDSFLNTTEATLLVNVQKCWASLFTPRAIFYRFEKGLHTTKISVAVVVQKMVESECSGIAFSVHPVTEDRNQLIIEAGFGLGEAIVSGSVTPDSYVVEKEPRRIIDTNISTQTRALYRVDSGGNEWATIPEPKASSQVLTNAQVLELSELILRIERHYGFPCDIEWAFEGGKFYITQSRPITTLSKKESCVIGTKFATQVLHDGDLVEVDADNGVVRIIERREPKNLDLFGYRDFTLATAQIGTEAESLGLYLDNFKITRPYFVVERKGGKSGYFIDTNQINRQKEIILKKIEADKGFVDTLLEESGKYYDELESLLSAGQPFSQADFPHFVKTATSAWSWMAGWWWTVEMLEEKNIHPELVEKIMAFRKKTEKVIPQFDHLTRVTAATLYPALSAYADVFTIDEITSGEAPPVEELKKRMDHHFLVNNTVFTGGAIDTVMRDSQIVLTTPEQPDFKITDGIFTGQVAYKGKYTGAVSIVFTKEGANAFPEGNVLVASSTTPDFIHAIKKAGAIIADEGGIISHAAITSRELKTPCIIGTKIATQVLHDGDLVEVDADNGVVRILEKADVSNENQ